MIWLKKHGQRMIRYKIPYYIMSYGTYQYREN